MHGVSQNGEMLSQHFFTLTITEKRRKLGGNVIKRHLMFRNTVCNATNQSSDALIHPLKKAHQ